MLRHIVLFAFNDNVPAAARAEFIVALRGLQATVPSVRSLVVGENSSPGRAQGYTHVLLETFDDHAGLAEYAAHPAHLPVAARIRAAATQLLAVDLEL